MRTTFCTLVLALTISGAGLAQSSPYRTAIAAAAALRDPGSERPWTSAPAESATRRFSSRAPGATLMIVGGACVAAGILVGHSGGSVLILGGLAVGAYGFYLYTR